MAAFGEALKRQREHLGRTIEALSAETRVNARHFAALEAEDYQHLPGGVFRRGILRAYLSALGLDEAEWMPRFEASCADYARRTGQTLEPEPEAWVAFAENVKRNRTGGPPGTPVRWLGVAVLLLLVLVAAWATWHYLLHDRLAL